MDAKGLRSDRARAVIGYIERAPDHPFARLVAAATEDDHDVVDLVVEPEIPQHCAVAILPEEPVRIHFPLNDGRSPTIHSRRDDFPLDQVHTNYAPDADGLCLCVWEENWNDLRRVLSAQALVERIRGWFSRTAADVLHQEGQALEPLLPASAHTLIVPPGLAAEAWTVSHLRNHEGRATLFAEAPSAEGQPTDTPPVATFTIAVPARIHGALRAGPRTLEGLRELTQDLGTDLIGPLRLWLLDDARRQAADKRRMLLILTIPQRRAADKEVEGQEVVAFLPNATLSQLGEALGCTYLDPRTGTSLPRVGVSEPEGLDRIMLDHVRVVRRLDRAMARVYAGTTARQDRKLVAIGAGAIGSNVVVGTTRAGIGTWTIIDNDIVLPHNTVRQFQRNAVVGIPKAMALQADAEGVLAEEGTARFICADILTPRENAEQIRDSLNGADIVVDFSASPAVLGYVSDQGDLRRAASFFFNPDGSDLVILAEDDARAWRLDEIEAQYFLAAATDCRLARHLSRARLDLLRYANACQDLTRPVPPWQVQTLTGLAGGQLLGLVEQSAALAMLWRLDVQSGAIAAVALDFSRVSRRPAGDWRFTVSHAVLQSMRCLRAEAAPNESGGILIGSFDLCRRVAHVVAALPAPPDSVQTPSYFERGSKYLKPIVDGLTVASAGVLKYLGEWHSHPDHARPRPSSDDETVDAYLSRHLGPTGAPHLIAICGREETWFRLGCDGRARGEAVLGDDGE